MVVMVACGYDGVGLVVGTFGGDIDIDGSAGNGNDGGYWLL